MSAPNYDKLKITYGEYGVVESIDTGKAVYTNDLDDPQFSKIWWAINADEIQRENERRDIPAEFLPLAVMINAHLTGTPLTLLKIHMTYRFSTTPELSITLQDDSCDYFGGHAKWIDIPYSDLPRNQAAVIDWAKVYRMILPKLDTYIARAPIESQIKRLNQLVRRIRERLIAGPMVAGYDAQHGDILIDQGDLSALIVTARSDKGGKIMVKKLTNWTDNPQDCPETRLTGRDKNDMYLILTAEQFAYLRRMSKRLNALADSLKAKADWR